MSHSRLTNSFAAIDLGSNSFHMVIAEPEGSSIRVIDGLRIPVRLGAGLNANKSLKKETRLRALDALGQFAQRLRGIPRRQVRVVGTNTLRRARNSADFMNEAQSLLGKRIEIISGREEARLIFSAVSHTAPDPDTQKLVIDIGGGSTELIIGKGYKPHLLESVNMGCVSHTANFFKEKKVRSSDFKKASVEAQVELTPIARAYTDLGWSEVTGCSGTIKAISRILVELELGDSVVTRDGLKALINKIEKAGSVDKLNLQSISSDRSAVICGGIAILHALMKTLKIQQLQASPVALREGLIFDMIGKAEHIDIQSQTLQNLITRFDIDTQQSQRVENAVVHFFNQVQVAWDLDVDTDLAELIWAARLHELGKAVAHTQYHKHGAYIIGNSDLIGFSMAEQKTLDLLIRNHRRKINLSAFEALQSSEKERIVKLLALLRLAVLIHRGRHTVNLDLFKLKVKENQLTVSAGVDWLEENPLTSSELQAEEERLLLINFKLKTIRS